MLDIVFILIMIIAFIIGTAGENSYKRFALATVVGTVIVLIIGLVMVIAVVGGTAPVVGVFSMGVCMLPHVDTHVHDISVWYDTEDGEWTITVDGEHYASTVPTEHICDCKQVCMAGMRRTHMERMQ